MTTLSLTNLDPYAKRLTALANKAGAGLPTTKITAKTWNTALDAALDRLEAPPVVSPPVVTAPPTPTSPPVPTTPPAQLTYLPGVVKLGLQAVDDLRLPGKTGPKTAPDKTPLTHWATVPGAAIWEQGGLKYFRCTKGADLIGWNLDGWIVQLTGAATYNLDGPFIRNRDSTLYTLEVGAEGDFYSTAPEDTTTVNLFNFEFDGSTYSKGASGFITRRGTHLNMDRGHFHSASVNYGKLLGASSSMTDTFVQAAGINAAIGSHIEPFQDFLGEHVRRRVLFDMRDGAGLIPVAGPGEPSTGYSGLEFPDPGSHQARVWHGPVSLTWDQVIALGALEVGSNYTMQIAGGIDPTIVALLNSVLAPGTSSRNVPGTGYTAGDLVDLRASGCVDAYTGENIDRNLMAPA